ncbi:MAG: ribosome biogenesis GTPase YlqF [Firmicutes bacterium]|nr:ribosome biogenesis GTPase YlqF [Bacillota bacterium]
MNDNQDLKIEWYPGHMAKSLRLIGDELKLVDAIVYILDARCPMSCINPKFTQFTGRRPTLFVLNKIDLAKRDALDKFKKAMPGQNVITLNSTRSGDTKKAITVLEKMLVEKINNAKSKGITRTLRAIVIGVTNTGKSTFINNISSKAKTITGDKPGVTRTKQWVTAGDYLMVLDTPGTLYPNIGGKSESGVCQTAKNLAYIGSIKDDILDIVLLSKHLIADLERLQPGSVTARFGASDFDGICKKRGYVLKGGVTDEERAAKAILVEFRAGKIGAFNLDELL